MADRVSLERSTLDDCTKTEGPLAPGLSYFVCSHGFTVLRLRDLAGGVIAEVRLSPAQAATMIGDLAGAHAAHQRFNGGFNGGS